MLYYIVVDVAVVVYNFITHFWKRPSYHKSEIYLKTITKNLQGWELQ